MSFWFVSTRTPLVRENGYKIDLHPTDIEFFAEHGQGFGVHASREGEFGDKGIRNLLGDLIPDFRPALNTFVPAETVTRWGEQLFLVVPYLEISCRDMVREYARFFIKLGNRGIGLYLSN